MPVKEARAWRRANLPVRRTGSWRMIEDFPAARGQCAGFFFGQQKSVLLGQEKTRSNCINTNIRCIFLCDMYGQPLRKIG